MNTKQIQFNRQGVAVLLFAGLILALAAGLAWTGTDASGSTLQPAQIGPSAADVVCPGTDFSGDDSELLPRSPLRSVKGSKPGVINV